MTSPGTRFWVDAWDPSYLSNLGEDPEPGGGPGEPGAAELELGVEVPAAAWAPMPYPADLRAPDHVLMVDGVRRRDAVVWTAEDGGGSYPGLAASYAAGVVHCDLRQGVAAITAATVERGLFTASTTAAEVVSGQVRYPVHQVGTEELPKLDQAAQAALTELEVRVAGQARAEVADPGDLLVIDGPLRGRTHLDRAIGYIKSHRQRYLPAAQAAVVAGLSPGQRCPVFRLGTSWHRYTWYLRLPGGSGAPWSGLVRAECADQLTLPAAVRLADLSVVTLPRFAASAYKDPRAPQNLVPIAGLEQRLRARLGDATLLHRALTRAAAAGPAGRRDGSRIA